ncbi:MAG: hypothetical protein AAFQ45_09035 [Pseudomonadota bacterium]
MTKAASALNPPPAALGRSPRVPETLDDLRAKIARIERKPRTFDAPADGDAPWRMGVAEMDCRLGPLGLAADGVHHYQAAPPEEGPPLTMSVASTQAFMLAVAAGRLAQFAPPVPPARGHAPEPDILWCVRASFAREFGRLSRAGLRAFGLDPDRVLIVEARRDDDVLWALEEALRSRAMRLVAGCISDVALTPARRLALACAEGATPLLMMTDPRASPVAAAATRWRISPLPSAPHPLCADMPGAPRFSVRLERCRAAPLAAADQSPVALEWCHDTFSFRMAHEFSDRTFAPDPAPGRRSEPPGRVIAWPSAA